MTCQPSLRMRLWLGAAVLALLAVTAAGIGAWGLQRMQSHAAEAMAAQRRIEAYDALSVRISQWMLGWMAPPGTVSGGPRPRPDNTPVRDALDHIDRLLGQDVEAATSEAEATIRARQSLNAARLRALFRQLDTTLRANPPDTPAGQAALAFHAAQSPGTVVAQVEHETRRRDVALASMEALRRPVLLTAALIAAIAPLVLVGLYLVVLRPLFRRLSQATAFAPSMAMGDLPPGAAGHDELGLMFARLRQQAARIRRRRDRLETIVEERTAELSAANERLALVDLRRRRFFADVGHELRTPLTVIMGEAELGARHPDAETRASFDTIGTRAQRLFRRIEDLLRIARSESGQLELASESVDLAGVVQAALADLAPVLKRAGVSVSLDLPPDLAVRGDADWLRQVFAGLFENAAKYAGRGASVTVSARAGDGEVQITVADTGPGLPDGMGEAIFDRFTRDDESTGFGVGLALARWVVETSGGSVRLAGSGPGLALEMTLPLWKGG